MNKFKVNTPSDALVYVTDCVLATVEDMAGRKSRSGAEYRRQKSIAQRAIDWMHEFGVDYSGTRAVDVRKAGSVEDWARWFEQ